ncbi:hypothetical protein SAMD00023353_1600590 [Rosellinia necatrix]|uniref:Uncharacterized protein n=1 Tax=Rosellinia necatrix TaxID=77044 RepID=A0A1W2TIE9_ROSNE|nr:hypothetical protein SAMD00023353_1600590 [Rosellinia necatrix]
MSKISKSWSFTMAVEDKATFVVDESADTGFAAIIAVNARPAKENAEAEDWDDLVDEYYSSDDEDFLVEESIAAVDEADYVDWLYIRHRHQQQRALYEQASLKGQGDGKQQQQQQPNPPPVEAGTGTEGIRDYEWLREKAKAMGERFVNFDCCASHWRMRSTPYDRALLVRQHMEKSQPGPLPPSDAKTATTDTDADAEVDAEVKAEADAKVKAEADAKVKAEDEREAKRVDKRAEERPKARAEQEATRPPPATTAHQDHRPPRPAEACKPPEVVSGRAHQHHHHHRYHQHQHHHHHNPPTVARSQPVPASRTNAFAQRGDGDVSRAAEVEEYFNNAKLFWKHAMGEKEEAGGKKASADDQPSYLPGTMKNRREPSFRLFEDMMQRGSDSGNGNGNGEAKGGERNSTPAAYPTYLDSPTYPDDCLFRYSDLSPSPSVDPLWGVAANKAPKTPPPSPTLPCVYGRPRWLHRDTTTTTTRVGESFRRG